MHNNANLNNFLGHHNSEKNNRNKKNNLEKISRNKKNNLEKISRNKEINKVKEALENFSTRSTSHNLQYNNITKTQVVKYHEIARNELLRPSTNILIKALKVDQAKKYTLQFESVRLSHNFYNRPDVVQFRDYAQRTALNNMAKDNFKLSRLKKHLNGTPTFPYDTEGNTSFNQLVSYHRQMLQLNNNRNNKTFKVKYDEDRIKIRYEGLQNIYIEWTYSHGDDLNGAIDFMKRISRQWNSFDIDDVEISDDESISANVIDMLTSKVSVRILRESMLYAKFPSRFWRRNELKQRAAANNSVEINIGSNFSNSKLSRIETFLSRVDNLFSVIADEREKLTDSEIMRTIDGFALRPHMYILQAQRQVVTNILRPQRVRNANTLT